MFTLIGFLLFFAPFMGIGIYGIGKLFDKLGTISTIFLLSSIPFYIFIIREIFRNISNSLTDIENSVVIDIFTIRIIVIFLILNVLSLTFAKKR